MPGLGQDVSIESGSPLPHQMLPPPEIFIYLEKSQAREEKEAGKGKEKGSIYQTMERRGASSWLPVKCRLGQLPGFPGPIQIYLFLQ